MCAAKKEIPTESVKELIHAAPASVDAIDPITGLLPFMLAGAEREDGRILFEASFVLLLENPVNVLFGGERAGGKRNKQGKRKMNV